MQKTKTETGEIISYNHQNKDWQVKCQDDTVVDIDADTLEYTVSRKTILSGAEIIYSHIVFDKKYKIDSETKRNVFLKWKASLVFDKDLGNVFCATPLEGRSLYVKTPSGLPGTTEDTIWVIKRQSTD